MGYGGRVMDTLDDTLGAIAQRHFRSGFKAGLLAAIQEIRTVGNRFVSTGQQQDADACWFCANLVEMVLNSDGVIDRLIAEREKE